MLIRSMRNYLPDSPPRTSLRWFDPPMPNCVWGRVKSRAGNMHFTRLAKPGGSENERLASFSWRALR